MRSHCNDGNTRSSIIYYIHYCFQCTGLDFCQHMLSGSFALPSTGVEYHLPQLADLRAAAVGVPDLDAPREAPLRHALLALHPALRRHPLRPAVRLGPGPGARTAPELGHHEPQAARPVPRPLPLPASGGHGEGGEGPHDALLHRHEPVTQIPIN